jgi:hypothetical protein
MPAPPPDDWLLSDRIRAATERLEAGLDAAEQEELWSSLEADLAAADADEDADVALPVLEQSLPEVKALVAAWDSGRRPLPRHDREILKLALKAFRKRLKLARLDDESSSGRNPLSKGEHSSILGVKAPEGFARAIWDALIRQGKLRDAGYGLLELVE